MIFPYMDILEYWGSKYALTTLAAKRAKQIKDGSAPLIRTKSSNPLTIALEEIALGKVRCEIPEGDNIVLPESVEPDITALLSIPIDSELEVEHLDEHEEQIEGVEEEEEFTLTPDDELEDEGETLEEEMIAGGLHEEEDESAPSLFDEDAEDTDLDPVEGPLAHDDVDDPLEDEAFSDEEEVEPLRGGKSARKGRSQYLDEELEESLGEMLEDVDHPESEEDLE
ncbi:MAG: DNA-directed RNA polymerase subunit omega [Armatimonadota bacterium]